LKPGEQACPILSACDLDAIGLRRGDIAGAGALQETQRHDGPDILCNGDE
jgi:hypothetical protein